jgi:hypothetical protein
MACSVSANLSIGGKNQSQKLSSQKVTEDKSKRSILYKFNYIIENKIVGFGKVSGNTE